MPTTFSLAAYIIRVRNIEERTDEQIDAIDGDPDADLFDMLRDDFRKLSQSTTDNKEQQQVLVAKDVSVKGREISGIIETGRYGLESTLYDVKKKSVVHKRTENEADMLPFFFLADIPKGVDRGILIVQRTGLYGIRQILARELQRLFSERVKDDALGLRINPAVDEERVRSLLDGAKVTQIRFVRYNLTGDIADYINTGSKTKRGYTELVVHAARGRFFNISDKIKQAFSGKTELSSLFELEEKFEYNTVKLGVEKYGKTKLIDLGNLAKVRSYYDITSELEFKAVGGHPTMESISKAASNLLTHIRSQMYGKAAPR